MGNARAGSYSEDVLVEQPTIALFTELGWETAVCLFETADHCPNGGVSCLPVRPAL